MPEPAAADDPAIVKLVKKRWRAWLRAVHRDFGYLAVGFTLIYAISGIAQNHIEDWGDVSFVSYQRTAQIAAIPEATPDDAAIRKVADAAGLGAPNHALRAGDEIDLEYANGQKVTAITSAHHTDLTIQDRKRRHFIGVANWLHTARGKKGWKYLSDAYAVFLLYLAMSGIFMIKGRLGFKWRGATLIGLGFAVPIAYVLLSGGPGAESTHAPDVRTAENAPAPAPAPVPAAAPAAAPPATPGAPAAGVLKPLPPDDDGE